jgi:hypothetical protein
VITQRDLYWLAGLIEGEGCFHGSDGNGGQTTISINMTDRDVIERAAAIFGATEKISQRSTIGRLGKKPIFCIRVNGTRAVGWMMTLYSLMGARRKQKIRVVLDAWSKRLPKNANKFHCKRGHPFEGENLRFRARSTHQRICRACTRMMAAIRMRAWRQRRRIEGRVA